MSKKGLYLKFEILQNTALNYLSIHISSPAADMSDIHFSGVMTIICMSKNALHIRIISYSQSDIFTTMGIFLPEHGTLIRITKILPG